MALIGPITHVDWDSMVSRNIWFMQFRVWLNPNSSFLASCMIKRDDGVMTWMDFRYERVYKVCKRCRIIDHFTPHYPHLNLDIERMINNQMESIQTRFNYEIKYDLQQVLFTNNLRAFFNKGASRTIWIEFKNRNINQSNQNTQNQSDHSQASKERQPTGPENANNIEVRETW